MIAKIITNKTIQLTNLTAWEEEIIDARFSASRPSARYIDVSGGSSWDGVYHKYNRANQTIARPFLGELRALCKEKDLQLVVIDKRQRSKYKPIEQSLINEDFLPGIKLKPFQIDAIKTIYKTEVGIINVSMGGGKCLGAGTKVICYDGTIKLAENVHIGDLLMGDDSTPRKVLAISNGSGRLFRVNQKYGDSFVVNEHHQLSLVKMTRGRKKWSRKNIEIQASDYVTSSKSFKNLCKGYKTSVEFANQNSPKIDPYLYGVWLGDGKSTDLQFFLSEKPDAAIIAYLQDYCDTNGYVLAKYDTPEKDCDTYCIRLYSGIHAPTKAVQDNKLKRTFRRLGLFDGKHIPHKFKIASKIDRLKLLAGLIDADGYTNERNDTLYVTLKKTVLVDDTVFLARSLGFRVTCRDTYKTDGNGFGDYYSRITISGHVNTIPCLVVKKQCKPRRINKDPLRYAIDVEPIGSGKYYGFQLDGNGRFLLGDFTVTHNSEMIAGICKAMPCPTVIIAEQIQVIEQLKQRLLMREVCSEPGLFYAGKMPSGQLIIIGSIQSLVKPKHRPEKPLLENFKDSKSGTAQKKFEKAYKNFEIKLKGFRSRCKKAEALHKLIGTCEMLLVDECVHEDTWIGTDLGVMPAKTLYNLVSSGVIVKAKVGSKTFPIIATHAKNGQAIEITTNTGRKLICSDNHPIATFDGFRRDAHAGDLQYGDLLLTSRGSINYKKHNINSRNKWYHLGLFIGDGHFLSNTSIRFAVRKDKKDWSNIAAAITNVWHGSMLERENKRGDLTLRIKSEELCDWLKSLGFNPGRKMGYMHPDFVIPDTNAAINLIRGLLDSEGSGYRDKAIFGSIDLPIAQLIQSLLSYVGIGSSIYIGNKRTNKKHKTLYRLLIVGENFIKFRDRIGFGFARKQKRIETCYNNIKDSERYINYGQYIDKWLESGIKKHKLYSILGIKQIDRRNNISLKRLIDWQNKINRFCESVQINSYTDAKNRLGISYEKVSKHAGRTLIVTWYAIKKGDNQLWRNYTSSIIEKLKIPIIDVSLDSFAVEKVASVKNSKKCRLIDFTVKNSESFEANGLLVHNCDLATSSTYKSLFRFWFNGRRRYGMTGTPYDADKPVENLVLQEHMGSVIYIQNREAVEKTGLTVPITYFALAFGEDGNKDDASAFDIAVNEMMVYNEKFHKFIAALCKRFTDEGTLILVERDDLGYALQKLIPDSEFIHGETSRKRRPEILKDFESRKLKVLIGGKNVRRGLDLKGGCENLILATGGKLASEFKQRVARAARVNQKGSARIFDIYFMCNKYLYAHSRKRFKAAVMAGYVSKVIFNDCSVEGEKFIKSRFHRPRIKSRDLLGQKKLF